MTATLPRPLTAAEFLAWEERQPARYEFDGTAAVAMTGGTNRHDRICVNLVAALVTRLRGKPCQPHGNSLKIEVMGSVRYPDAFVTCQPLRGDATVAPEPVVVFEVLSRGTARIDRITKNAEYSGTRSIRRYVMLEQGTRAATVFERVGEDWVGRLLPSDAVLRMPEIDVELPMAELYEGIEFDDAAGDG